MPKQKPKSLNEKFLAFADWVSTAMGSPINIALWALFVIVWTGIFAFGGAHIASGRWLPQWFTSQGFNFPLNLITTVAELFIGFLCAAATNRAQRALTGLLKRLEQDEHYDKEELKKLVEVILEEHTIERKIKKTSKS